MKTLSFGIRNTKEIIRDPLTIGFSLGFPLVLLVLLSAIQANVPVPLFEIESLAPGIAVFGLSFMTLFSANLIARDRESALFERLCTTPMRSLDFILGYMLPIIPIATAQGIVCYLASLIIGLDIMPTIVYAIAFIIPISVFYIAMGLLFGSILNVKQVGGVCGALFTNLSAWLSGIWFDVSLVGGAFEKIANALPFIHAVELERAVIRGAYGEILPHLLVVSAYGAAATFAAVLIFLGKMKKR